MSRGLHYVDPYKRHGVVYRIGERFGRSRPGQAFARHIARRVDPWFYRVAGRSYSALLGAVGNAPLTTTGAKSGQRRVVQLTYFHDGNDPILIASNFGGPRDPQWSHNLKAHPECEFGGEKFLATEVTDPDEYARLYDLANRVYAGWSDYRAQTDPIGRHIPVFRLTAR